MLTFSTLDSVCIGTYQMCAMSRREGGNGNWGRDRGRNMSMFDKIMIIA